MKKLMSIFIVALGLAAEKGYAAGEVDLMIKENKTLVVSLDDVEKGDLLFFTNKAGEVLFKDSLLLDEPYSRSLDLRIIPRGIYYINLEKKDHILVSVIEKTEGGIFVRERSTKTVFKPCYKQEGKKVTVFLTSPNAAATHVEVLDTKGRSVGKAQEAKYTFTRTFDFSGMPAGEYIINLRNGDRKYKKVVRF